MKTVPLGDVAEINPRGDRLANDDAVSFVGMAELDAVSARAIPLEERAFGDVSKGYTVFRDGDLLAAKITPCWENGKVGEARLDRPVGVGSTEFHVIRPLDGLDRRYAMHFLRQPSVRLTGELRMTGSAGQKRVPTEFLKQLSIPLPSLAEQRRVAAILDQADALRAKRRQALAHLDSVPQAIFHEMFGSGRWDNARLGTLAKVVTGSSPSRAKPENFGGHLEWIKSDNLGATVASRARETLSTIGESSARVVPAGSVLVTCIAGSPASIGKCSIVDRQVSFNQQINAVLPSADLDGRFLLWQLKAHPQLVREKSSGGMKGLVSKSAFESVEVLVPPVELQLQFAALADEVDAERSRAQAALEASDVLFASLQSRAFTGAL